MSTSPTRDKIIETIGSTKDDTIRAVLMIMLAVLEEISGKIDDFKSDELSLRESVLNGHASAHDAHHHWIAQRIENRCEDSCSWVKAKIKEEEISRADSRKLVGSVKEKIINMVLGGLVVVLGLGVIALLSGKLGL